MNFIYVTDIHLSDRQPINRVTPVIEAGLFKLDWILNKAKETDSILLIGGDFFHSPCPSMDLLNKVIALLTKYKVPIYLVLGNHDTYGNDRQLDDTAIQVLFNTGLIYPLTTPQRFGNFIIAGINYYKLSEEEKANLKTTGYPYFFDESMKDYKKVLIAHLPIVDKPAIYEHILIGQIKTNANLVLCGHIHQPFREKLGNTVFYNPGCVIRRAKNEKDQKVRYLFFNETTFSEGIVPAQVPEFNTLSTPEEAIATALEEKIEVPDLENKILTSGQEKPVIDRCLLLLKSAQVKFNEKGA